jgi:hypothetical protein
MKKASISLEINLKSFIFVEKVSHHLKKDSIPLKTASKTLVILKKASDF